MAEFLVLSEKSVQRSLTVIAAPFPIKCGLIFGKRTANLENIQTLEVFPRGEKKKRLTKERKGGEYTKRKLEV